MFPAGRLGPIFPKHYRVVHSCREVAPQNRSCLARLLVIEMTCCELTLLSTTCEAADPV